MRKLKKIFPVLLTLCMAALMAGASFGGDPYTYTVRVFTGNRGTIGGNDVYTVGNLRLGDEVHLDAILDMVAVNQNETDSIYYVKDLKYGGEDDRMRRDSRFLPAFTVDGDYDFVVAYGVGNNLVGYTLHFVETGSGKELAAPITRYGNVGDKPVASYQYIEGYEPLYKNLTATLQASGNNWTFYYKKAEQGQAAQSELTDQSAQAETPNMAAEPAQPEEPVSTFTAGSASVPSIVIDRVYTTAAAVQTGDPEKKAPSIEDIISGNVDPAELEDFEPLELLDLDAPLEEQTLGTPEAAQTEPEKKTAAARP